MERDVQTSRRAAPVAHGASVWFGNGWRSVRWRPGFTRIYPAGVHHAHRPLGFPRVADPAIVVLDDG